MKNKIPWGTVDYQGELLTKLEGKRITNPRTFKDKDVALHVIIAKHFPYGLIQQALQATQDAVRGGKEGWRKPPKIRAYYIGTLKSIAHKNKFKLPLTWEAECRKKWSKK